MRVLIVEDDKNAAEIITKALRREGFTCDGTDTGEDAIHLAKISNYDVILLDMMLPDGPGMEVIRRLRGHNDYTPIVILSALDSISDKVNGLSKGADDYIQKPASIQELIARLQAVVRRKMGYAESIISCGRLSVNLQTKTASADGMPIKLTSKEYNILELLILKKGYTLNKDAFLAHLYDESNEEPSQKIIDVFICKLRKKIQAALSTDLNYIETIWGRGYMLVNPSEEKERIVKFGS